MLTVLSRLLWGGGVPPKVSSFPSPKLCQQSPKITLHIVNIFCIFRLYKYVVCLAKRRLSAFPGGCSQSELREWGNFAVSMGRPQATMLSASGGFAPPDPHHGLCPWTPLGALPQTIIIGVAMCPSNFYDSPPKCWEAG